MINNPPKKTEPSHCTSGHVITRRRSFPIKSRSLILLVDIQKVFI